MAATIHINPIGSIQAEDYNFCIRIKEEYRQALKNIEGFTHLQVVWWGNLFDSPENRRTILVKKPYKKGPDEIGIFATRSQIRPNPVLITTVPVQKIDMEQGLIYIAYIDAEHDTPVLDIKPYHLSERVKDCAVPLWCGHWPQWYEDSAEFAWGDEFNF